MPTAQQYTALIQAMTYSGLDALYAQIRTRHTPGWPLGKAFEYLIVRAFELEGASVQYPYPVGPASAVLEQIDGAVHIDGISALVESKDLADGTRVNIEPIAKLRNQLLRRPAATVGMIFSRTGFTDPALVLSQYLSPQTILVWQGGEIDHALQQRKMIVGLRVKYRMAVEMSQNDFSLLTPGALSAR